MLRSVALRNYLIDRLCIKVAIINHIIDAIILYFKCFVSRFSKTVMIIFTQDTQS